MRILFTVIIGLKKVKRHQNKEPVSMEEESLKVELSKAVIELEEVKKQ